MVWTRVSLDMVEVGVGCVCGVVEIVFSNGWYILCTEQIDGRHRVYQNTEKHIK